MDPLTEITNEQLVEQIREMYLEMLNNPKKESTVNDILLLNEFNKRLNIPDYPEWLVSQFVCDLNGIKVNK